MLVCRHPVRGGLWERAGVWRARCCPQPLQLQLGRRLREEGLRRHPHLLTWMSLPVWHLPGWRGMPDNFLQGESDRFKILPIEVTVRRAQWNLRISHFSKVCSVTTQKLPYCLLCLYLWQCSLYKLQKVEGLLIFQNFDTFAKDIILLFLLQQYNSLKKCYSSLLSTYSWYQCLLSN